jgi:hypothetical protein
MILKVIGAIRAMTLRGEVFMNVFISLIVQILSIDLNLGTVHLTLGEILGAGLILKIAVNRLFRELSIDPLDRYSERQDDILRQQMREDSDEFWSRPVSYEVFERDGSHYNVYMEHDD